MKSKSNKNTICCIIPARGGSKGIKLKNLKKIDGYSLVARAIFTASKSKIIDEIYVSSDNDQILQEAKKHSAVPLRRSFYASTDESTTEDALFDAIQKLENQNIFPDIIVYIQCTSPFINHEDIDNAINKLLDQKNLDTIFSAAPSHAFLWKIKNGIGYGINHNAYKQRKRRQDLDKTYREDGCFYVLRVNRFKKTKNRFGRRAIPHLSSRELPFEIDKKEDLEMARALSSFFNNK